MKNKDEMYNPLISEMRPYLLRLEQHIRNLTPEQAREDLLKARLISEDIQKQRYKAETL